MLVLTDGDASISYRIRRTARAKRIRITVRPGGVSVTAPRFTMQRTIVAFVESKREWIFAKVGALRERELVAAPPRFVSGAKVLFRGRSLSLHVTEGATEALRFASAFHVTIRAGLGPEQREDSARRTVMTWLRARALADAETWARQYVARLGAQPARIRIGNQKTLWGSCSARGVISLNWRLIAIPKSVFEYVVVHELCHLVEHNHGARFWKLVESLLPDYRDRRLWLKQRGVGLG